MFSVQIHAGATRWCHLHAAPLRLLEKIGNGSSISRVPFNTNNQIKMNN